MVTKSNLTDIFVDYFELNIDGFLGQKFFYFFRPFDKNKILRVFDDVFEAEQDYFRGFF